MHLISLKMLNPKIAPKNFSPNFWEGHGGLFFLKLHLDNDSGEKTSFQVSGYGTSVFYPTN